MKDYTKTFRKVRDSYQELQERYIEDSRTIFTRHLCDISLRFPKWYFRLSEGMGSSSLHIAKHLEDFNNQWSFRAGYIEVEELDWRNNKHSKKRLEVLSDVVSLYNAHLEWSSELNYDHAVIVRNGEILPF